MSSARTLGADSNEIANDCVNKLIISWKSILLLSSSKHHHSKQALAFGVDGTTWGLPPLSFYVNTFPSSLCFLFMAAFLLGENDGETFSSDRDFPASIFISGGEEVSRLCCESFCEKLLSTSLCEMGLWVRKMMESIRHSSSLMVGNNCCWSWQSVKLLNLLRDWKIAAGESNFEMSHVWASVWKYLSFIRLNKINLHRSNNHKQNDLPKLDLN